MHFSMLFIVIGSLMLLQPVKYLHILWISVLTEIGKSSKAYTELCGRTEVLVTDVLTALVDQGLSVLEFL